MTICPKCHQTSGNSWSQCAAECPMPMSPHYHPPGDDNAMKAATYCGPAALLRGKTALVKSHSDPALLQAQFDDRDLTWGGDRMGFGWHSFNRTDFTIHPEETDDRSL